MLPIFTSPRPLRDAASAFAIRWLPTAMNYDRCSTGAIARESHCWALPYILIEGRLIFLPIDILRRWQPAPSRRDASILRSRATKCAISQKRGCLNATLIYLCKKYILAALANRDTPCYQQQNALMTLSNSQPLKSILRRSRCRRRRSAHGLSHAIKRHFNIIFIRRICWLFRQSRGFTRIAFPSLLSAS